MSKLTPPELVQVGNLPELVQAGNLPELVQAGNLPELVQAGNLPELVQAGNLPELVQANFWKRDRHIGCCNLQTQKVTKINREKSSKRYCPAKTLQGTT